MDNDLNKENQVKSMKTVPNKKYPSCFAGKAVSLQLANVNERSFWNVTYDSHRNCKNGLYKLHDSGTIFLCWCEKTNLVVQLTLAKMIDQGSRWVIARRTFTTGSKIEEYCSIMTTPTMEIV